MAGPRKTRVHQHTGSLGNFNRQANLVGTKVTSSANKVYSSPPFQVKPATTPNRERSRNMEVEDNVSVKGQSGVQSEFEGYSWIRINQSEHLHGIKGGAYAI